MPRYHFNIEHDDSYIDREGIDLLGLPEARAQAVQVASELLRDQISCPWDSLDLAVTVTDGGGLALFQVLVTSIDAPATLRSRER